MPVRLNSSGGGSVTLDVPSTAGTFTATVPANTGTLVTTGSTAAVTPAMLAQPLTLATAQNSTSGTSIDFTGIPSWVRRITVLFNGVSTNGNAIIQVQLGTSSGVVTTGYSVQFWQSNTSNASATTGFAFGSSSASGASITGLLTLVLLSANTFVGSGSVGRPSIGSDTIVLNGSIALSGVLDRVRITTVGGTDTFDAGSINIMYEG